MNTVMGDENMKKILISLLSIILFWEMVRLLRQPKTNLHLLSQREQEILNLIAEGYSESEIAVGLRISQRIIKKYLCSILKKWNLYDVSSAIEYATEKGLVRITYA